MKLTTKGRYAIIAMIDIALRSNNTTVSLTEIAKRQEISLSYLEQLFSKLKSGSLVKSIRGPGGGYILDRDPSEITFFEITATIIFSNSFTALSRSAYTLRSFPEVQRTFAID